MVPIDVLIMIGGLCMFAGAWGVVTMWPVKTTQMKLAKSRGAMIAALKHIDGTAKLFSHREKTAVLYQLKDALSYMDYPIEEEKK